MRRDVHILSLRDAMHTNKLFIYIVVIWIKWKVETIQFQLRAHTHPSTYESHINEADET